ncbi:MAG: trehalose-6-phosphate synthase [Acidobacteria bacterium]|nr:trehalose-6-phosphate synthase [Acidobacteriota bacterium]
MDVSARPDAATKSGARPIVILVVAAVFVAVLFDCLRIQTEMSRQRDEIARRAIDLGQALAASITPLLGTDASETLKEVVQAFGSREGLTGLAVYNEAGAPLAMTAGVAEFGEPLTRVADAIRTSKPLQEWTFGTRLVHSYTLPLVRQNMVAGVMVLFHDASDLEGWSLGFWELDAMRVLLEVMLVAGLALVVVRRSVDAPVKSTAEWIRRFRTGDVVDLVRLPTSRVFEPLVEEVMHLTKSVVAARKAAEEEARLRDLAEAIWTPERLKEHMRVRLQARSLVVVSNREPYIHVKKGRDIRCIVPPSGVVTATEPVLRACGGTWIAFGGGDADRETSDADGRLKVPPDDPRYTLRRVWLTAEEENGHYYGFSNEGLWPLCHIAHTRPSFEIEDWEQYQAVNAKFASATVEELEGVLNPYVLVHDYHFALVPQLIKAKRPDARVAIFWHIPWPNPEAFSICPWQKELLKGLLGADLVGFHIQFHCNNFLETVDRALESRIDRETFAINRMGHTTWVKPFPISVAFPTATSEPTLTGPVDTERLKAELFRRLRVRATHLGVGVDRLDYTKGLMERFRSLERFLDNYPSYRGKLTFVELGAPSRTRIQEYRDLASALEAEAERINRRFSDGDWRPLVLLQGQHTHDDIRPFYQAADFCLVTSLHDGMNLVAKEYVAARDDERGALILSCFTGAARELEQALIVNPYDLEQVSEAIHTALEMSPMESRTRMVGMRQQIKEANVYRWAGSVFSELCQIGANRATR